jgi:biofilm PGA synthesis protein PgaD
MHIKNLIFEKPALAPLPQRIGWTFFTAFFWMVWVYLWLPLITLGLWAAGAYAYGGYIDHNVAHELRQLGHTAFVYTTVVCFLGGSLLLWARIEFLRFHNVHRRSKPVPVTVEELAAYAKLPVAELALWEGARRVVAHHDAHGHVIYGEIEKLAA